MIWSQRHILGTGAGLAALLAAGILALAGIVLPLLVVLGLLALAVLAGVLRKGVGGTLQAIRRRTLPYLMIARGFLRGLKDPSAFPADAVRVVQRNAPAADAVPGATLLNGGEYRQSS